MLKKYFLQRDMMKFILRKHHFLPIQLGLFVSYNSFKTFQHQDIQFINLYVHERNGFDAHLVCKFIESLFEGRLSINRFERTIGSVTFGLLIGY